MPWEKCSYNGTRLSHVDWRANRLVDQLAKVAAKALCAPIETVKLLDGCDAACAHAAALLGIVTHAANNHKTVTYDEEGKVRTTIQRDSTDKPKKKVGPPNGRKREQVTAKEVKPTRSTSTPAPWREPAPVSAAKNYKNEQQQCLDRRVAEIGASLRPSSNSAGNLSLVQQRILAKVQAKAT